MSNHWSVICDVSPEALAPLTRWIETADNWSDVGPTKPSRIQGPALPAEIVAPVIAEVMGSIVQERYRHHLLMTDGMPAAEEVAIKHSERVAIHEPMLSRMLPGQSHPYHTDVQRSDCVTRVHVPITTNPGCWMMFEDEGERVHFETGRAYTFNTLARHAFGNDGDEPRVHLIFEVLRA